MKQAAAPKLNLIEHVAAELAATFYEVGRSQGLKSRHKNARTYALNNLEKFVPHAVKHLLEQLNSPSISAETKEEIWESLQERMNDPTAQSLAQSSGNAGLPDIDVAKVISVKDLPSIIVDQRAVSDYETLRDMTFKAKRH